MSYNKTKNTFEYQIAVQLENDLGDIHGKHLWSLYQAVNRDKKELFPSEAFKWLLEKQFFEYLIPVKEGGKLSSLYETCQLVRTLAQRDPAVALVCCSSFAASQTVWISGSDEQRAKTTKVIREGGLISLGLTEKEHGADLNSSEVYAESIDNSFILNGEKWLINNIRRAQLTTVIAKTSKSNGPRSLSLFLVDQESIKNSPSVYLDKINTHGVRCAEIAGVQFKDCYIPQDAKLGKIGRGLELTLKGLLISRTMISPLALGTADTALRCVFDFTEKRKLYGESLFQFGTVKEQIVNSYIDLILAECVTLVTTRALQYSPEKVALYSAIAKYFVPTKCEQILDELRIILGARHYLRDHHWSGIFEKLLRDVKLFPLFDGSVPINLALIGNQLQDLFFHSSSQKTPDKVLFQLDIENEVEGIPYSKLELFTTSDEIVGDLYNLSQRVIAHNIVTKENLTIILESLEILIERHQEMKARIKNMNDFDPRSSIVQKLSQDYCALFTASSLMNCWLKNTQLLPQSFKEGSWVVAGLDRILVQHNWKEKNTTQPWQNELLKEIQHAIQLDLSLSFCPFQMNRKKVMSDAKL